MTPKKLLIAALLPAALSTAPAIANDTKIEVHDHWARASIGTSRPTAAFMVIVNKSKEPDRLLSARSPAAGRVEVHRTVIENGRGRMIKLETLTIPAGGKVTLKPGGHHIMLMQLKRPIEKGTKLPLVLVFEHAGTIAVEAPVRAPGASGMKHHHH